MTTLKDFEKELKGFDSYYEMSDDHKVWSRGSKRHRQLGDMLKSIDATPAISKFIKKWNKSHVGGAQFSVKEDVRLNRDGTVLNESNRMVELNKFFLNEAKLYEEQDVQKFKREILVQLQKDFPYAKVSHSELGGIGRWSIHIHISLDTPNEWQNNIYMNSRYGIFTIDMDGSVEKINISHKLKHAKFRKFKAKDAKSIATGLDKWARKV